MALRSREWVDRPALRLLCEKQFKVFRPLRCLEGGRFVETHAMPPSDRDTGMFITLHGLEAALVYTRAAVLVAHPDLGEEGPSGRRLMKLDAAGRYAVEVERERIRAMVAVGQAPRERAA